jgi:hypothetical protein
MDAVDAGFSSDGDAPLTPDGSLPVNPAVDAEPGPGGDPLSDGLSAAADAGVMEDGHAEER